MSVTFTDRNEVVVRSSVVASSRRWRVCRPRSPGTRPSVVATGSAPASRGTARGARDGASGAEVVVDIMYRYFTSKAHLLAATLVHWVEMLDTRMVQHPPREEHPADRVLDVLDRALRAIGRQPKLVAAVFTSLSSPDPAAVGCQQQITLLMEGIISRAMGEFDIPDMADRARMIGHVWYSALIGWINGWSTMVRVYDELAVSVRLLLSDKLSHR